jgi:hypothetical protein
MAVSSWHEAKPLIRLMRLRWIFSVGASLALISTTGCLRILSLDYQATNSIKGQGAIYVALFQYQAADEGPIRPHEVETPPRSEAKLFLSDAIGTVFSVALQSELARSGYAITESSPRAISGVVTRFYLDWTKETERKFELEVTFAVQSAGRQSFSWRCSSLKRGSDMLENDSLLIKAGIADCIQHFLLAARNEQVL